VPIRQTVTPEFNTPKFTPEFNIYTLTGICYSVRSSRPDQTFNPPTLSPC